VAGREGADRFAGTDLIATRDRRYHRLVCGSQSAGVADAHHAAISDPARVEDLAVAGRAHDGAGRRREIDAAMAGEPRLRRRIEPSHHPQVSVEGCTKGRRRCGGHRTVPCRTGCHRRRADLRDRSGKTRTRRGAETSRRRVRVPSAVAVSRNRRERRYNHGNGLTRGEC
jgi:hypothetical protein